MRRNHPDVGGDHDTFVAGLAEYDELPPATEPIAPPPPPRVPATDRIARGMGRIARDIRLKPTEVREAYREGRDTDAPLSD